MQGVSAGRAAAAGRRPRDQLVLRRAGPLTFPGRLRALLHEDGPAPDCKAIIVVAQFEGPDAAGTVPGFNVQLRSDWLLKRDNDEQRRQQVEAEKAAEKKRHDAEVNAARKNQPQL